MRGRTRIIAQPAVPIITLAPARLDDYRAVADPGLDRFSLRE